MTERLRPTGRSKNFYPVLLTIFLQEYKPKKSCSGEGAFRKLPCPGQSESWPDRGSPDRPMDKVERREAQRLALGARGLTLPREAGSPPASRDASQASWRLPPLHRPRAVRGGLANLGRIAPRECGSAPVIPGRPRASRANPESRRDSARHLWIPGSRRSGAPRNDGERAQLVQRALAFGAVQRKRRYVDLETFAG